MGHHFLSVPIDILEINAIEKEIKALKPKVKEMLMPCQGVEAANNTIRLIYLLVSLVLACHFVDEIGENIKHCFKEREKMMANEDDLYTVSVIFWVFRTYGQNMSSDVFERFKGNDGKFKECLARDVKGMLSLYEAVHLETMNDEILDKALSFTSSRLELLAEGQAPTSPHIAKLIRNAVYMSQHKNNEMIFAREYISFYGEEEDHNKMLLRLAKLSFKSMQLQSGHELKILTKWWKEQDISSKLPPYFRDRLVECYFFAFGVQPQLSRERIIASKIFILMTILDDTCDRYGFLSEIKILVDCIERCDPDSVDRLPDYMKHVFKFALNVFQECESVGRCEEIGSYGVQSVLEEFKILMRSCIPFAKWEESSTMPTFDEYMEVGDNEIALYASLSLSFLGLGHSEMEVAYKWLTSRPKLLRALAIKARLMDDMTGFEDDTSRGCKVNAITCYMKEHRVSKEETLRELPKVLRDINKQVNEEFLKTAKIMPIDILHRSINCENMTDVTFRDGDGFTIPIGRFKDHMTSLFVDLMPL